MGFRYELRAPDGTDAGQGEYGFAPQPGDEIYIGARRMLVTAVVPVERMQEHVTRPLYGILEIQPL
jgi:hypothetical protein